MCGIAGAVNSAPFPPLCEEELLRMRDSLVHRGPDDAGQYLGPGVALASRRLAILDLSERGHMPMSTPDGRFRIVHNGEIYNYQALRRSLETCGYSFRSNTDTEVLLALYAHEGPEMLGRLNGMFAFAIRDERDRSLFLARDRVGIKPLYFTTYRDTLFFASEPKALFAAGVPAQFDPSVWEELLRFGYVAGENTPFAGIRRLLPGHFLLWREGRTRVRRWWSLAERVQTLREQPLEDPGDWFRETFDSAVGLRRISDVPIGLLLSGGLDSGSVAASLAMQAGNGVESFTVRFADPQYDEGSLAREVAKRWQLAHHELTVAGDELPSRLREVFWYSDEPTAHHSDVQLTAIARYAKPHVTVLLSGEGADETLCGYVRYQPLRVAPLLALARWFGPALRRAADTGARARKLSRMLSLGPLERFVLFNSSNVFPDDLAALGMRTQEEFPFRERVLREACDLYPDEPARQAMYCDLHVFLCSLLDRNDRTTMAASIECRTPFLDYRLIEGLAALPTAELLTGLRNKPLLRRTVGDRLPEGVRHGRKWGFGVPWVHYLRQLPELRETVASLADRGLCRDGPFDRRKLRAIARGFLTGAQRYDVLVLQLVMLTMWHDAYFDRLRQAARYAPHATMSTAREPVSSRV